MTDAIYMVSRIHAKNVTDIHNENQIILQIHFLYFSLGVYRLESRSLQAWDSDFAGLKLGVLLTTNQSFIISYKSDRYNIHTRRHGVLEFYLQTIE